jgi:hypothetical protein
MDQPHSAFVQAQFCMRTKIRKVEPAMSTVMNTVMNAATSTVKTRAAAWFAACCVGLAVLCAAPANAATRVETMNNSCATVQRTLIQNGAAILRYPSKRNPSLTLYDRYVGDSRFCASTERGVWASVPAKDTQSCRVIACKRFEPDAFFPFNRNDGLYLRLRLSN